MSAFDAAIAFLSHKVRREPLPIEVDSLEASCRDAIRVLEAAGKITMSDLLAANAGIVTEDVEALIRAALPDDGAREDVRSPQEFQPQASYDGTTKIKLIWAKPKNKE